MSSVTLPQAKLIKRTAWMKIQIEERRRRGTWDRNPYVVAYEFELLR